MKTYCAEKGCDWSGSYLTKGRAAQGLGMHTARKHTHSVIALGETAERNGSGNHKPRKQRKSVDIQVNFCPQCGCDIGKTAMGMALAGRLK